MARSRGEGTLFQRKDGRWQASLQVYGVRKTVYGRTRQQAHRKLAELQRQAAKSGALPNPGTRTLGDLLDGWLETAAPTLRPRTLHDYRQTCRLYIRPSLGKVRLDRLTPDRIQRLYTALQKRGLRRAPAKAHAVLHRALRLAVLWGWLAENPTDRVLRPQYCPLRRRVWTHWELNAFLDGAGEHWLYPIWVLAIVSGCRPGELRGLTWDDVDLDAGSATAYTITISKTLQRIGGQWMVTEPKTRAGTRTMSLPREGMAALRRQRGQQTEWRLEAGDKWNGQGLVFTGLDGRPLGGGTVNHALARECRRLGITEVTPHGLRHLHASLLLQQGLPVPLVSARLGHAHSGVTLRLYAHAINGHDRTAAKAIHRALREAQRT